MRYDLKKFLFVGVLHEKNAFFKQAQELGIIHFIQPAAVSKEAIDESKLYINAIKVLRGIPPVDQVMTDDFTFAEAVAKKILEMRERLDRIAEEERILKLDIGRVEVFGDFSLEQVKDIEKESKRTIRYYFAKADTVEPGPEEVYVGSNHGLDYFISFSRGPKSSEKLIEIQIDRPVGELRRRLAAINTERHNIDVELKYFARYNNFLHHALIHAMNQQNLSKAEKNIEKPLEDGSLFAAQGWVPVNKVNELQKLATGLNVYIEETEIEPTDAIPTYLENESYGRIGEDLVRIYDTPSHTDKDPSMWVLGFFSLFFAFIVGDAGYGLTFLLAALYMRYKFSNAKAAGKRFIRLCIVLSVFCIGWGLLTGSFFGMALDVGHPLKRYSLIEKLVEKRAAYHIKHHDADWQGWVQKYPQLENVKDPYEFVSKAEKVYNDTTNYELIDAYSRSIMLELALLIGIFHLTLSFLRYIKRNWAGIGWILVMFGGYLYAPKFLGAVSIFNFLTGISVDKAGSIGLQLVGVGMVIVMVISIIKHKIMGIFEVMTILQVFSDVLSYLRLFALGLAGAIVGATINELAGGLPFVFSVILVVLAHLLNMGLGIMGGVIHGLRLNFLEWYHYSFEGGGKQFEPLRLMKIE